jgi:hypothetical protein
VSRRPVQGLLVVVVLMAAAGCGSSSSEPREQASRAMLPGWRAVDDPPGISQLAPDLSGLHVTSRADSQALVRNGDVIRATSFVFASREDAVEAQKRGAGDDYQRALEEGFRGNTIGRGPGVGVRLEVARPTGAGSDTVEVYLLRRGRMLTVVELESGTGFDPAVRTKALRLFSR